jgi:hypothetical protein
MPTTALPVALLNAAPVPPRLIKTPISGYAWAISAGEAFDSIGIFNPISLITLVAVAITLGVTLTKRIVFMTTPPRLLKFACPYPRLTGQE